MKGKDNNFKDLTVQTKNVANALDWPVKNNPHYKEIINNHCLNSLPIHGTPEDLLSVETRDLYESEHCEPEQASPK